MSPFELTGFILVRPVIVRQKEGGVKNPHEGDPNHLENLGFLNDLTVGLIAVERSFEDFEIVIIQENLAIDQSRVAWASTQSRGRVIIVW